MKKGAGAAAVERWRRKIAKKFEAEQRYLIPALQYVQNEAGYLPSEAMTGLARHLRVSEAKVYGVASFYAQFHFEPRGRNTITVCRGTACHVRGSGALLKELENQLGVEAGGTTRDLDFSLETVACYGSCALAPVVVLNDVVHRQQTAATMAGLIASASSADTKGGAKAKRKARRSRGGSKKGARR
jgi:NADH:ubiquinone oxidoreductase subunit E